jgi:hypothetical protein
MQTKVGKYTVSSIMETPIGTPLFGKAGETCVFNDETNDSEVVGTYGDHAAVVAALKFSLGMRPWED